MCNSIKSEPFAAIMILLLRLLIWTFCNWGNILNSIFKQMIFLSELFWLARHFTYIGYFSYIDSLINFLVMIVRYEQYWNAKDLFWRYIWSVFAHNDIDTSMLQPSRYIACLCNDKWYIWIIMDRCNENGDVEVNFRRCNRLCLPWYEHSNSYGQSISGSISTYPLYCCSTTFT